MTHIVRLLAIVGIGAMLVFTTYGPLWAESPSTPKGPQVSAVTLKVEGMTCPSCAFTVRTALRKLDGVRDAKVSKADSQAVVYFDASRVTPQRMIDAINRLGYVASLSPKNP
jgi:copper chaperone CopZ